MTLKEYLDLKATGYILMILIKKLLLTNQMVGTEKIQLGALKTRLDEWLFS